MAIFRTPGNMEPGVHALQELNSPYDDFNAVAVPPPLKMDAFIVFASNASTQGEHFTLETGRLRLKQDPYPSRLQDRPPAPEIITNRTGPFVFIPEAAHNHLGPTPLVSSTVPERHYEETFSHYMTLSLSLDKEPLSWSGQGHLPSGGVWMFDSDQAGSRNLYFLDEDGQIRPFFGNLPGADDAYATYDFKRHELFFSSNRSGRFQIYRYRNTGQDTRFSQWLGDKSLAGKIEPALEFSAQSNTLAPFIEGNLLVFVSDRSGGHGGYDLYAARYEGGKWQEPFNMQKIMPRGVELNTPANEFRPSILTMSLKNYLQLQQLIFSSDRPGGKGGYDLYMTALPHAKWP
ncbi:MAG: hypothetical protein U5L00_18940 [Desulfovermiculus sp.]|nr:hypothetical protein [Desulfovermiculus sp.]